MKAVLVDFKRTLFDPEKNCLLPQALEFLQGLKEKKFKIGLVAKNAGINESTVKEMGIFEFFDFVSLEDEKSLEQYKTALDSLKIEAKNCFCVGDRVVKEIKYGNELGCVTVWVRQGKFSKDAPKKPEEEPNITVENLSEAFEKISNFQQ